MALSPHLWLCERFASYYRTCAPPAIPRIERREFGFGGWERKIEFRHMCFATSEDLRAQLVRDRPLFVSASSAYYEFPDARPMARKNWLGADLVFDLDAPSDKCASGKNTPCSPFTCDACLHLVRENMLRLVEDFLLPDFGLSRSELQISFSGSRGFHVRAYKKELEPLGRDERREIVDYIEGSGLTLDQMLIQEPVPEHPNMFRLRGPTPTSGGYGAKFARRLVSMASDPTLAPSISPKLKKKENAERFVSGIKAGRWSDVPIPKAQEVFQRLLEGMKLQLSNQVDTDVNVTFDLTKILRMPDTIHGGSGLLAKTIPLGIDLSSYEPMHSALAFRMDVQEKIRTTQAIPSISMGNQTFDALEKDKTLDLPQAYAVYLVCKKAAIPA